MQTIKIPNEIIIPQFKQLLDEGHTVRFRVRGFSMRPFLEDRRDIVTLTPLSKDPEVGDAILAEVAPQTYVLHRIIRIEGDKITLQGDGNINYTESCLRKDVVGIVTEFYRKGRKTPDLASGKKWRYYSKIWLLLTPLRRYLLYAHRNIWLKIFPPQINKYEK